MHFYLLFCFFEIRYRTFSKSGIQIKISQVSGLSQLAIDILTKDWAKQPKNSEYHRISDSLWFDINPCGHGAAAFVPRATQILYNGQECMVQIFNRWWDHKRYRKKFETSVSTLWNFLLFLCMQNYTLVNKGEKGIFKSCYAEGV